MAVFGVPHRLTVSHFATFHTVMTYFLDSPVTDEYLFAHLSHEDQTVVLEWVNTLLYIKYTLLKSQNPTVADKVRHIQGPISTLTNRIGSW